MLYIKKNYYNNTLSYLLIGIAITAPLNSGQSSQRMRVAQRNEQVATAEQAVKSWNMDSFRNACTHLIKRYPALAKHITFTPAFYAQKSITCLTASDAVAPEGGISGRIKSSADADGKMAIGTMELVFTLPKNACDPTAIPDKEILTRIMLEHEKRHFECGDHIDRLIHDKYLQPQGQRTLYAISTASSLLAMLCTGRRARGFEKMIAHRIAAGIAGATATGVPLAIGHSIHNAQRMLHYERTADAGIPVTTPEQIEAAARLFTYQAIHKDLEPWSWHNTKIGSWWKTSDMPLERWRALIARTPQEILDASEIEKATQDSITKFIEPHKQLLKEQYHKRSVGAVQLSIKNIKQQCEDIAHKK